MPIIYLFKVNKQESSFKNVGYPSDNLNHCLSFFNYWIFVAIMIYFMFVGKRLKKEANNNLLWFYGIYTTFSYAVFGYFINSTILLYIGEKIFDQYMYLISITIAPLFSVLCNVILLRLILPSIRFLEKHLDSWNQYFLFS